MIKLFWLLLALPVFAAHKAPHSESGSELELTTRLFYRYQKINYLLSLKHSKGLEENNQTSFRFGGKIRLSDNIKAGFYLKRTYGARHEDDWVRQNGKWQWQDTSKRGENTYIFELYPRFLITDKLVFQNRIWLAYNDFNHQQTLKIRPGLTYFSRNINWYFIIDNYLSLNFSRNRLYDRWVYTGFLYHLSKNVLFGPYLAYRWLKWHSTEKTVASGSGSYNVEFKSTVLGLSANLYF